MAIKINNLNLQSDKGNTFLDIHFDLQTNKKDGGKQNPSAIVSGNDILVDSDLNAIRNSLINLMTTNKGQRPLNLDYGLSLYKFIGEPINTITATAIAKEIERGIGLWEPRVTLTNLYIYPNEDQLMYEILIFINIPALGSDTFKLGGNLEKENGFKFVESQ